RSRARHALACFTGGACLVRQRSRRHHSGRTIRCGDRRDCLSRNRSTRMACDAQHQILVANGWNRPYMSDVRDFACLASAPTGLSQEHAKSGYRVARMVVRSNAFVRFKEANMATGTVKFFNSQKGFGFIQQEGGGPDVFVHVSAVERAGMRGLVEGQKVSFDIEADRRSGKSAAANLQTV